MIAPFQVDRIKKMLAEKELSQRQISLRTGISRSTIRAIASGKHNPRISKQETIDEESDEPSAPPERCPTCGGWVHPPCRLCLTRSFIERSALDLGKRNGSRPTQGRPDFQNQTAKVRIANSTASQKNPPPNSESCDSFFQLNLKPQHQEAYEEVRRWRREYAEEKTGGVQVPSNFSRRELQKLLIPR